MRANPVKQALRPANPSVGTWLSLGSITASRFLARCGFAWLTVDIEHSLVDWETATHMFASIADAGCTALARVPANRHDHIKRVLDNGAQGVVVPMVNSRAEAEDAVAACLYPPVGNRSVGGSVHALNFEATASDYFARANDELLVVLQCEHIQCVENADAIFSVPGIDAIFVGPNDLAASMRSKDGKPPSGEATSQAMKHILSTCKKHHVAGRPALLHARGGPLRIEEGWQFIAIGSELRMMMDAANDVVKRTGLGVSSELAAVLRGNAEKRESSNIPVRALVDRFALSLRHRFRDDHDGAHQRRVLRHHLGVAIVILALLLLGAGGLGRRRALLADDGNLDILVGGQIAELRLVAGLFRIGAFQFLQLGPGELLDPPLLVVGFGRLQPADHHVVRRLDLDLDIAVRVHVALMLGHLHPRLQDAGVVALRGGHGHLRLRLLQADEGLRIELRLADLQA